MLHTPIFIPEYTLIRNNRRTVSVQISPAGQVLVRCPHRMSVQAVEAFVREKAGWINKHLAKQRLQPKAEPFTDTQLQALAAQTKHSCRTGCPCLPKKSG